MNITLRKLAMLEQSIAQKEEAAKLAGYATCAVDKDLQQRVSTLMNKVRSV